MHPDLVGPAPDPETVRSVLVIRPGGLAEVVRAVPALRHLRATYPDAIISVAATTPSRDLLEACPYVDRPIDLARPSEALLESFDIVVSLAAPTDTETISADAVRAGFRAAWRRPDDVVDRRSIRPTWPERIDDASRMLRLAWLLGGSTAFEVDSGLWPSLADRNGAARLVESVGSRPMAIVHVGSGGDDRRWPAAAWARVLDLLCVLGVEPVLVGTEADREDVEQAAALAAHGTMSLVGRTSVGELVGVLERAVLFVGSDSGPAALAEVVSTHRVVVGPRSPFEHRPRPGSVELVGPGPCATCGEAVCSHPQPPAVEIPLEAVLARVELVASRAVHRWRAAHIA